MAGSLDLAPYALRLFDDEGALRRSLRCPVLLWLTPPEAKDRPLILTTDPGRPTTRPRPGKPVIFEVKKAEKNAFSGGITIGRASNNDIAIEDTSISRFHAYFSNVEVKQHWELTDADSRVGTWVNSQRLDGKERTVVSNHSRLRVGHVELVFLEPASFVDWLRDYVAKK
jgi:pSer/pThr/pTyr-binding forkhead associated (FHA) protein